MLLIFLCNQVFIHIKSICVASLFHAFQRNADYRILSLIRHIFRISCDFQAVKKISVAFLSCLKKSLQHTHVECFAESSWSGEKIDGFFVFQELLYHQRFIDKVVPVVHQPLEILYANRQGFVFHVLTSACFCNFTGILVIVIISCSCGKSNWICGFFECGGLIISSIEDRCLITFPISHLFLS